jgi:hypothetical protein
MAIFWRETTSGGRNIDVIHREREGCLTSASLEPSVGSFPNVRESDVGSLLSWLLLACCSRSPLFLPAICQRRRMDVASGKVVVPIFSGLGTSAAISEAWLKQSLSDSHSPSGSLLLQSCYHAFVDELASLSSNDLRLLGISLDDFPTPTSLLTHERNTNHILLSHSFLFLSQALRWLSLNGSSQQDAFVQPFDATVGCLAFSLGVLITPVIASSTTLLDYLSSAVEAYKVSLRLGVRVHLCHHGNSSCVTLHGSPRSIVCSGISSLAAQRLIADFHTAVSDTIPPTAHSNPSILESRVSSYISHRHTLVICCHYFWSSPRSSRVHQVLPRCLLSASRSHLCPLPCQTHTQGTRDQVLYDIRDRGIKFPTRDALKVPIVSTFTGLFATANVPLVEEIVDMILIQIADWDQVASFTVERLKNLRRPIELLNVGPGDTLANDLQRRISAAGLDVRLRDISTSLPTSPVLEPIAVVGMAVNMPGAPNPDRLWEILHNGDNTLSQVRDRTQLASVYPKLNYPFLADSGNAFRHDIHPRIPRFLLDRFWNGKFPLESRSIR